MCVDVDVECAHPVSFTEDAGQLTVSTTVTLGTDYIMSTHEDKSTILLNSRI